MTDLALSASAVTDRLTSLRPLLWGFCYWLVFLLVLEPDNVLRAVTIGEPLLWPAVVVRILGAAALGASATPVLLLLVRRYPVEGTGWMRRLGIQICGSAVISAVLIFISCIIADWFLASEHRPFMRALPEELQANWTLLTFAIGGLLALLRATQRAPAAPPADAGQAKFLERVTAKTRGVTAVVDLADVDWVEAQGNYVALHTASDVHLIRRSLAEFEAQIDPDRFVRIHRRVIVAVDRIAKLQSRGSGDGMLHLKDGTELRLSRGFRDRVTARIAQ